MRNYIVDFAPTKHLHKNKEECKRGRAADNGFHRVVGFRSNWFHMYFNGIAAFNLTVCLVARCFVSPAFLEIWSF